MKLRLNRDSSISALGRTKTVDSSDVDLCDAATTNETIFPDSAYDLAKRCLDLDPTSRITAAEALKHPFLSADNFIE